ncbi:hypothetical protein Tco_0915486 [Tanacetum coccineum]
MQVHKDNSLMQVDSKIDAESIRTLLCTANRSSSLYFNSQSSSKVNNAGENYQVSLNFKQVEALRKEFAQENLADFINLEPIMNVSPIPTSRINSIHPSTLILGDPQSAVQTRSKVTKSSGAHAFVSYIQKQRRNNHKDFQHCLFACFLSQNEPKKISEALEDESWVDAMQEELLQFKIQKVWILVDLPYGKKAIGTK